MTTSRERPTAAGGASVAVMSESPGHDIPTIEDDETVAPRPEEEIADVARSRPDPLGHGGDAPEGGGDVATGTS